MKDTSETDTRHLVLVLGDQLNEDSAAFDGFDKRSDAVLMMELTEEADWVPQHKIRLAGIDAPERGRPFGKRSKERMS